MQPGRRRGAGARPIVATPRRCCASLVTAAVRTAPRAAEAPSARPAATTVKQCGTSRVAMVPIARTFAILLDTHACGHEKCALVVHRRANGAPRIRSRVRKGLAGEKAEAAPELRKGSGGARCAAVKGTCAPERKPGVGATHRVGGSVPCVGVGGARKAGGGDRFWWVGGGAAMFVWGDGLRLSDSLLGRATVAR